MDINTKHSPTIVSIFTTYSYDKNTKIPLYSCMVQAGFASPADDFVEEYLNYKRKCGFALKKEGELLLYFVNFADKIGCCGPETTELTLLWSKLSQNADLIYWAKRLDIVSRFTKYRSLSQYSMNTCFLSALSPPFSPYSLGTFLTRRLR